MFSIEVGSIIFFITLCLSCALFYKNFSKIIRNINLGKSAGEFTDKKARWKNVFFIAFGQKKMFKKPLVAVLHLIIYLGFVIIKVRTVMERD